MCSHESPWSEFSDAWRTLQFQLTQRGLSEIGALVNGESLTPACSFASDTGTLAADIMSLAGPAALPHQCFPGLLATPSPSQRFVTFENSQIVTIRTGEYGRKSVR
jgi:hypothetical protein